MNAHFSYFPAAGTELFGRIYPSVNATCRDTPNDGAPLFRPKFEHLNLHPYKLSSGQQMYLLHHKLLNKLELRQIKRHLHGMKSLHQDTSQDFHPQCRMNQCRIDLHSLPTALFF